jgi:hypothetical protein
MLVDRNTPYGNPFVLNIDGDRNYVCEMYEKYAVWRLSAQPDWLKPLVGHNLGCHCAPKRCHAETLLRLANRQLKLL